MSLRVNLNERDRQRTIRALAAYMSNDRDALALVLEEVARDHDPTSTAGLILGLLSFGDYATDQDLT